MTMNMRKVTMSMRQDTDALQTTKTIITTHALRFGRLPVNAKR